MDEREDKESASSIEATQLCPGRPRMCKGLSPLQTPQQREWAESGERIHLWLEDPSFCDLNEDDLHVAKLCEEQREQLLRQAFPDLDNLYRAVIVEKRLWLRNPAGDKIFSGKGDYAEVVGPNPDKPEAAIIFDFKTNRGDVTESVRNPQLRALAVLLDFTLAWEKQIKIPKIYTGIIQPLASGTPELCCYERPHLDAARKQILRILEASSKEDAPLIPGEKQCKYCPAKLKCPAAAQFYWDIAATTPEDVTGATGQQLSDLLDKVKVAAQIIDMVEAQAKELLNKDPASIPNWKLEPNSPTREITSTMDIYTALASAGKIDSETFLKATKVGIGKLETAVRDYNKLKGKPKLVDAIFEEHCSDHITLKPKAPTLKRI